MSLWFYLFWTSEILVHSFNPSVSVNLQYTLFKKLSLLPHFEKSCQSLSHVWLFVMPDFPVLTISQSLLKLMSIKLMMPPNHFILCHPLLLLPSTFSSIRVFSRKSALRIRWPKYWSFSFSISPSNKYSTLISFRIDWFDLLVVQGTLKSLLQHHSSKASTLQHSAFLMVQLSHTYTTTGKTIALSIWTLVGKVMSLLFDMLSGFVIAFLFTSAELSFCH